MRNLSLLLIGFAVVLTSCSGTKFIFATDMNVKEFQQEDTFKLDNSYKLYVRQIVRVFDSSTKTYKPANATVIDGKNVVEIEYMLISDVSKRVIIFNNIPSIYQDPYATKTNKFNLTGAGENISIDMWYFRQFRFGTLMPSNTEIDFLKADGTNNDHKWNISFNSDNSITINSIAVADGFGETVRNINEAFAIPMIFRKVDNYQLIFQNKNIDDNTKNVFYPDKNTFFIVKDQKKLYVLFAFATVIQGESFKNVMFSGKRIYALP